MMSEGRARPARALKIEAIRAVRRILHGFDEQVAERLRVLIHGNGGPQIGMGHAIRSLALAEQCVASGHEVVLAGEYQGDLLPRMFSKLEVEVRHLDGLSRRGHLLAEIFEEVQPNLVHLDTYEDVDVHPWLQRGVLVSNVEDGAFGRREASIVIDPNFGAERGGRPGKPPQILLRGARYAPLRSALMAKRGTWRLRQRASRVLVVMGGTDPLGLTPHVLRMLDATGLTLEVTAISSKRWPEIESSLSGRIAVETVDPVEDVAAIASEQDLVVSAAGTSIWEFCCLGIPMALVCAVDNQRAGYQRLVGSGAALGLGSTLLGADGESAARRLRHVLIEPAAREDLAEEARSIVDGLGAWRIVRAWEHAVAQTSPAGSAIPIQPAHARPSVWVRPAQLADAEILFSWRNDPVTRQRSRQADEIQLSDHVTWLHASLLSSDRVLLLGFDELGPVGTVRWDRTFDDEWEVSITVAPERRGQSRAKPLLRAGEDALRRFASRTRALTATVHEDNRESRRLFGTSDYLLDAPPDQRGMLTYRKLLLS